MLNLTNCVSLCRAQARFLAKLRALIRRLARQHRGVRRRVVREGQPVPHRDRRDELRGRALARSTMLAGAERFAEAADLMRERIPEARAWLGDKHETTMMLREAYCSNIVWDPNASANALRECEGLLEVLCREERQIFGASHPSLEVDQQLLQCAQARLAGKSFTLMTHGERRVIPPPRK